MLSVLLSSCYLPALKQFYQEVLSHAEGWYIHRGKLKTAIAGLSTGCDKS